MVSVEPMPRVGGRAANAAGSAGAPRSRGVLRARTTVPAPSARAVERPGIAAMLDEASRRRLTLVSAGAGWGKTTAAAAWARSRPAVRVAWLTLERHDDSPPAFWSEVVEALRVAGSVPPGHPLDALRVPARVSPDLVRRLLSGIEQLPGPAVLVLDDFHVLTSADVLGAVGDLLRYPLPLRLVLLTRTDPVLATHRLRAQGEIAEIGAQDLAFDAAEIATLGAAEGFELAPAAVSALIAETGGWAVGVRLQVCAPGGPPGASRARRSVAGYLLEEVLEREDPQVQTFLLRTSVVNPVCAELATVLDPGAPADRILAEVSAGGFVTALASDGTWYRYHPLLRETLQDRLRLEDPDAERAAHRAAATWYARHGEDLPALEHAVASHDWDLVGDVFVEVGAACLVSPHRAAVAAALGTVPFASLELDASLHLAAGCLALVSERIVAARMHTARARALLADRDDRPVAHALLELLEAATARARGDVTTLATSGAAALAALDAVPFPFPALDTYRGLATSHRAAGIAWCTAPGAHVRAETTWSGGPTTLFDLGTAGAVALAEVAAGHLGTGADVARQAVDEARTLGWSAHVQARPAYAALAWCMLERAADDEAGRLLALALGADAGGLEPASELAVRLLQVLVATSQRRSRAARMALLVTERLATDLGGVPPVLADLHLRARTEVVLLDAREGSRLATAGFRPDVRGPVADVCRARLLLAAGRPTDALKTVDAVDTEPLADPVTAVEADLVRAAAQVGSHAGRPDRAIARALRRAVTSGVTRPFLVGARPEIVERLLRATAVPDDAVLARLHGLLGSRSPGPEPRPLVEPLTERELAILAALPTMESNAEIAADFFVSVNTVKSHLKSLYRKLEVGSRREAVRRGTELGLLS